MAFILDLLSTEGAASWMWLALGLVLLSSELMLPGIYLLWIGLAGIVVGISLMLWADLGLFAQVGLFSVLSVASVLVAVQFFRDKEALEGAPSVNQRGEQNIGRICPVVEPITAGRGHVKLGDSRWLASGPDAPIGAFVKIVALDGSMLIVEPVRTGDSDHDSELDQGAE